MERKTFTKVSLKQMLSLKTWPHGLNSNLAADIGTYETLVVHYLHHWLEYKKKHRAKYKNHFKYKKMWIFKTLVEWSEDFPYVPAKTLRNVLERMRVLGILSVGRYNKMRSDRTLWYTINYNYPIQVPTKVNEKLFPRANGFASGGQMHLPQEGKCNHICTTSINSQSDKEPSLRSDSLPHRPDGEKMDIEGKQKEYRKRTLEKNREKVSKSPRVEVMAGITFWKTLLAMYDVTTHIGLTKAETGMFKNMMKQFAADGVNTTEFLEFCVSKWDEIRRKVTWPDQPKKSRLGTTPFFKEIYFTRDELVILWEQDRKTFTKEGVPLADSTLTVYTNVDDVPKSHPNYDHIVAQIEILGKAEVRR